MGYYGWFARCHSTPDAWARGGENNSMKDPGLAIREFARRLQRDYAQEISADPRAFTRRVKQLLGLFLSPGPGRPRKELITRAQELLRQGVPWRGVYAQCIDDHASPQWKERRLEIARLRNGVRARQRRKRGRSEKGDKYPLNLSPKKCAALFLSAGGTR